MTRIEGLTAETAEGRQAIRAVMERSYAARFESVPAAWARVRLVDGVPVSFILVDPDRRMQFPGGDLRYAFIGDVATREDRRGEGHFRGLMEDTFAALRAAGIPLVVTHGEHQLYRRFGFDVFTHHCGIFATPELIERRLGTQNSEEGERLLVVEDGRYVQADLLLIPEVRAGTFPECRAVLRAAAALARRRGKARILFEHPPAPSYGSRYPIYPSPETALAVLARACGAQVSAQGGDPESRSVGHADWAKALDPVTLLAEAVRYRGQPDRPVPKGTIAFATDAGPVTVASPGEEVIVSAGAKPGTAHVGWPSSALAQLVTGYHPAEVLATLHRTPLAAEVMAMLDGLFPQRWRFSRNESWTSQA